METSRLICCEKTGSWAIALRHATAARTLRIYETRSFLEAVDELAQSPASFLVLEATPATLEAVVGQLMDLAGRFPRSVVAMVGPRSLRVAEWLAREAGAVHVVVSTRQCHQLVRLATRHLAQQPQRPRSLQETVLDRIPWRGFAAADG